MASRVLTLSKRIKCRNCIDPISKLQMDETPKKFLDATYTAELLGVDAQASVVHAGGAKRLVLLQDARHLAHREVVRERARPLAVIPSILLLKVDNLGQRPAWNQSQ